MVAALALWALSATIPAYAQPLPPPADDSQPGTQAAVAEPQGNEEEVDVHSPDECPAIFGDAQQKAENKKRHNKLFNDVGGANDEFYILHHAVEWRPPAKLHIGGIELDSVDSEDPAGMLVIFDLSAELAAAHGCPAGLYEIEVDDSVADAAVLAVNTAFVLLEYEGELAYLPVHEGASPTFDMIWKSPFAVVPSPDAPQVKNLKSRKPKKARRKRRKRR